VRLMCLYLCRDPLKLIFVVQIWIRAGGALHERPRQTDYFFCSVVVPSRASRRSSRPVRRS
jgi:hypothetical protein